jgi:hypothetical protein
MSSIDNTSVLSAISAMEKQLAALRAQIGAAPASAPAAAGKPVKEKKPRKKSDAPPSAWRLFADRVRALLKDNGYSGTALGTECVQFCSSLKDENADFSSWSDADILGRRAGWTKPEVSKQAEAGLHWKKGKKVETPSGSVVSDGEEEAAPSAPAQVKKVRKNPWEGLTEEQKAEKVAAMKAGRAAKKAASSEAAPAPAPAPAVAETSSVASDSSAKKGKKWSEEAKASAKAKRAAKKVAAPAVSVMEAAAVPLPASPASSVESGPAKEFQGIMLGGKRYLVNLESGHCYERLSNGSQGDWAGLFHRTGGPKNGPHIDTKVAEPSDELTFLEE